MDYYFYNRKLRLALARELRMASLGANEMRKICCLECLCLHLNAAEDHGVSVRQSLVARNFFVLLSPLAQCLFVAYLLQATCSTMVLSKHFDNLPAFVSLVFDAICFTIQYRKWQTDNKSQDKTSIFNDMELSTWWPIKTAIPYRAKCFQIIRFVLSSTMSITSTNFCLFH